MPPPNTPDEGSVSTTTATTIATTTPAITAPAPQPSAVDPDPDPDCRARFDLKLLDYEGDIDENLICPICRLPLVEPTVTKCDHAFCYDCIARAVFLNPVCPVDRLALSFVDYQPAPMIIKNQLDNLRVRCPNWSRGCDLVVARSLVENHVVRYCDKTIVPCPHPHCDKSIARKDAGKGCLHYTVYCKYCGSAYEKAELEEHQDNECTDRNQNCTLCDIQYVRHKQDAHEKECPEAQTPCKFAQFGCTALVRRKGLEDHAQMCDYRVVGPVGQQMAELRAELQALKQKDQLKERRIKFLENKGFSLPSAAASEGMAGISLGETTAPSDPAPYESRDQYFLSLFETMEAKVERLSTTLNEVEGRHSVMLFNETLPIKDQLTEIRSTLGVLGMHVRWLMNFRLQERGRVTTSSANLNEYIAGAQDNNSSPSLPRRTSDSVREHPPRL